MDGITVGELRAALGEYADHLKVVVEIDPAQGKMVPDEDIFAVFGVVSVERQHELLVGIEWG